MNGLFEFAWDVNGSPCDGHAWPEPKLDVPHQCGRNIHQKPEPEEWCGTFICNACSRAMPWCYGTSESQCCDDCWVKTQGAAP